jgi:hypothetical protein
MPHRRTAWETCANIHPDLLEELHQRRVAGRGRVGVDAPGMASVR